MPTITGKRALLSLLRQEGISLMFGNPGTTELPLMDALAVDDEFRYVLCLQESIAMAMADGYARATGGIAAVNLHAAPGVGNAMGMLYDAQKAGTPILVTAGQQAHSFSLLEPNLWADLPPMARPLVKWATEVHGLKDLPRTIHRAVKTALAPPTGPVFVSLPVDVLNDEAELDLGVPSRVAPRFSADSAAVERAARILAAARAPVIVAGDAVAQSDARQELADIAELLGAPVHFEGETSAEAFPLGHRLFRGVLLRIGPAVEKALLPHDVLFSAGADLFTMAMPPPSGPVPAGLRMIHLDTDPWQIAKNYPVEAALFGDPKATLPQLAAALRAIMDRPARAAAQSRADAVAAEIARERAALEAQADALSSRTPIAPLALMRAVGRALPADAVVIDETISSGQGLFQFLRCAGPRAFHGMKGGGIGWGIPAAIGAKLAEVDRPVVALIGDGSAMYSIQGLWTAAHERLAVVIVIINNRSYRVLKQRLNAMRGLAAQVERYVAMELTEPAIDFVGLARSMGVHAVGVDTLDQFDAALRAALARKAPSLLDVRVDANFKAV
ncbi:MAG: thiamine pyrophosphate-binding protein [Alphaproteobacteria bacterium]|nr:thiamine pyrophosphate-binding protein [Alphaproteobacteria bacterium]